MRTVAAALVIALAAACGDPLDVDVTPVDLQGDLEVSPDDPGEFIVTVENNGDERITWGRGSSSCQLSLFVIADNIRQNIDWRICTEDLIEQGLDPGESRSETFEWDGHVPDIEGRPFLLPEGRYPLIGAAGTAGESEPLWVTVGR